MNSLLSLKITDFVPRANGWASVEKALEMAGLILESKPAVVVELGVFAGRSLIPMAMALRENEFGVAYGVDSWRTEVATRGNTEQADKDWWRGVDLDAMLKECVNGIWERGLEEYCCLIRATSVMARPLFTKIDVLHVDSGHSTETSMYEVHAYVPIVTPGGYVVADDIDWVTVQPALQYLNDNLTMVKDVGNCRIFRKS